jgi:hypothetical protein
MVDEPSRRLATVETSDGIITTADEIDALIAGGGSTFGGSMAPELAHAASENTDATKFIQRTDLDATQVDDSLGNNREFPSSTKNAAIASSSATKYQQAALNERERLTLRTPMAEPDVNWSHGSAAALRDAIDSFIVEDDPSRAMASVRALPTSLAALGSDSAFARQLMQLSTAMSTFKDLGAAEIGDSVRDLEISEYRPQLHGSSHGLREMIR